MKKLTISQALERYMNSPELVDKEKAWIGCDLDGTLAKYDGWKGWDHIGDPVPNMVTRIKNYMARGITVKIWTARASKVSLARNNLEFSQMEKVIQDWTEKHLGKRLEVVARESLKEVRVPITKTKLPSLKATSSIYYSSDKSRKEYQ